MWVSYLSAQTRQLIRATVLSRSLLNQLMLKERSTTYILHSTVFSWLQNGQLNVVGTFCKTLFIGFRVDVFFRPIAFVASKELYQVTQVELWASKFWYDPDIPRLLGQQRLSKMWILGSLGSPKVQ